MSTAHRLLVGLLGVALGVASVLAARYRLAGEQYRLMAERAAAPAAVAVPSEPAPAPAAPAAVAAVAPEAVADKGVPTAEIDGLHERIRQLEGKLADKDATIDALRQASTNRPSDRAQGRRDRFPSPESFRTNNPAMFAEFEKRRQEAQQTLQTSLARKSEYLVKKDTSRLSEDEKAQYEQMVSLMDETWRLAQQMQGDLAGEQRREAMRAMRDNIEALDPLLQAERVREFQALGTTLGYDAAKATEFAAYLTDVIDLTSTRNLFPDFRQRRTGGAPGTGTRAPDAAGGAPAARTTPVP